jgi:hypothetical protein
VLPKTYFGDLILAAQIIFISTNTVYLLLALAKRSGKKESRVGVNFVAAGKQQQQVQVGQNLPEVVAE